MECSPAKRQRLPRTDNEELSHIKAELSIMDLRLNQLRESVGKMTYFLKNSHLRYLFHIIP